VLDLKVEIASFAREVSTSIQQYQVVALGSPQRSRRLKAVSRIDFKAATPQDAGANVTSAPVGVDEEDSLVIENRATPKWWWLVHPALPRLARVGEGNIWRDCPPGRRASQEKSKSFERCFLAFFGSCDLVRGTSRRLSVSFFAMRVVVWLPALNESCSHATLSR